MTKERGVIRDGEFIERPTHIFFVVEHRGKVYHLTHNTTKMGRPDHMDPRDYNVELEFMRYLESPNGKQIIAEIRKAGLPSSPPDEKAAWDNPFEQPNFIGALGLLDMRGKSHLNDLHLSWVQGVETEEHTNKWWERVLSAIKQTEELIEEKTND